MLLSVEYPRFLEDWWINRTLQQLSCHSLVEREPQLERAVQQLSDLFTKERSSLAKDYFAEPELLCAYGLFFFPQNFIRTRFVLNEIFSRGWNPQVPVSILDLGSGAGAASFGAASLLQNRPVEIMAVDRSHEALTMMQRLASDGSSLWPMMQCEVRSEDVWNWFPRQDRKWDLILASFSFNESEFSLHRATETLRNALTERGIVILLEPALKSYSERLEAWRDLIGNRPDLHIWGPCLHRQLCPLLLEGKFWCHEVRSWQPPTSLAYFNRHLYRQVHVLKFSFLVFGKTAPEPSGPSSFRLISPVARRKKSLIFTGCTNDGKKKDFHSPATLTKEERKRIKNWERGDIVDSFWLNPETLS